MWKGTIKMDDDGDIFALINEECELDDEWLKEKEREQWKKTNTLK